MSELVKNNFYYLRVGGAKGAYETRSERNSAYFALSLTIEGTTEKVLKFIMPLRTIYKQKFSFV